MAGMRRVVWTALVGGRSRWPARARGRAGGDVRRGELQRAGRERAEQQPGVRRTARGPTRSTAATLLDWYGVTARAPTGDVAPEPRGRRRSRRSGCARAYWTLHRASRNRPSRAAGALALGTDRTRGRRRRRRRRVGLSASADVTQHRARRLRGRRRTAPRAPAARRPAHRRARRARTAVTYNLSAPIRPVADRLCSPIGFEELPDRQCRRLPVRRRWSVYGAIVTVREDNSARPPRRRVRSGATAGTSPDEPLELHRHGRLGDPQRSAPTSAAHRDANGSCDFTYKPRRARRASPVARASPAPPPTGSIRSPSPRPTPQATRASLADVVDRRHPPRVDLRRRADGR